MVFSQFTLTDLWYDFGENEIPRALTQELGECSEILIFHDIITPSFVFTPLTITLALWKLAVFDDWPNMSLICWDVGMDFHYIVFRYSDLKRTSGKSRLNVCISCSCMGKMMICNILTALYKNVSFYYWILHSQRLVLFVRLQRKGCRGNGIVASWSTETRAASGFAVYSCNGDLTTRPNHKTWELSRLKLTATRLFFLNSSD